MNQLRRPRPSDLYLTSDSPKPWPADTAHGWRDLRLKRGQHDIYDRRAPLYGRLSWVLDTTFMKEALQRALLEESAGVVDLGCGPAHIASLVSDDFHREYLGIDKSPAMATVARQSITHAMNATISCRDFLAKPAHGPFHRHVFLLKNVLHLVPDIRGLLRRQLLRWGLQSQLLVVETVSPNDACREWVRGLFACIGLSHKRHFFTQADLSTVLAEADYIIEDQWSVPQFIDVGEWLRSFCIDEPTLQAIQNAIAGSPREILERMKVHNDHGRLFMLRQQSLMVASPPDALVNSHTRHARSIVV